MEYIIFNNKISNHLHTLVNNNNNEGFKYDYKSKQIDMSMRIGDLPPFCSFVIERMMERNLLSQYPDQLIVNGTNQLI